MARRSNKQSVGAVETERPDPPRSADGDLPTRVPATENENDEVPQDALPRPVKLPRDVERNLVEGVACPECGYAVTKQRLNNINYRVCTGNYNDPSLCSWFHELDSDGNYKPTVNTESW